MKFKKVAYQGRSKGKVFRSKPLVQPNKGLQLRDILERFVLQKEPLPIGKTPFGMNVKDEVYSELDVDLEKMATADLTEQDEFAKKLADVKTQYEEQEKRKSAARAKRLAAEQKKAADAAKEAEIARRVEERLRPPGGSAQ